MAVVSSGPTGRQYGSSGPKGPAVWFFRPEGAGIMNAGVTKSPGPRAALTLLQARMGRQCNGSRKERLISAWLLCQPFGLFRTEVPADRGSGSHGSHCIGPPGLSSQWASAPLEMRGKQG